MVDKLWAVFIREYVATVRTKSFLAALVLMPLLMAATVALPFIAQHGAGPTDRVVAVVDRTGVLYDPLERAAKQRNEHHGERLADTADRFVLMMKRPSADPGAQGYELSRRVRTGDLFAFVEIQENAFDPAADGTIRYYTATPTYRALPLWLDRALDRIIHHERLVRAGLDADEIAETERPIPFIEADLYSDAAPASTEAPRPRDSLGEAGIPIAIAMLMFLAVMMSAGPLMQSVLEEKMHRIAEILVASIPPFPLMMGKLLGASAVSFTLLGVYVAVGWAVAAKLGYDLPVDPHDAGWIIGFQVIALLMYGSVFLAVGSACNDLKQTQTLMMPIMIVVMTPLLLLQVVIADPNGPLSTGLSLVPFFTPLLMTLRVTLPPGAPLWQAALGLALSSGLALTCVAASARIFRVGMLAQGAAPRLRDLARWVVKG